MWKDELGGFKLRLSSFSCKSSLDFSQLLTRGATSRLRARDHSDYLDAWRKELGLLEQHLKLSWYPPLCSILGWTGQLRRS